GYYIKRLARPIALKFEGIGFVSGLLNQPDVGLAEVEADDVEAKLRGGSQERAIAKADVEPTSRGRTKTFADVFDDASRDVSGRLDILSRRLVLMCIGK